MATMQVKTAGALFVFLIQACCVISLSLTFDLCAEKETDLTGVLVSGQARSTIECCSDCMKNKLCKVATYRQDKNECILFDETSNQHCENMQGKENTDSVVVANLCLHGAPFVNRTCKCPNGYSGVLCDIIDHSSVLCNTGGYTYYAKMNVCMKIYTERTTQALNKAKCQADGGHLLLIRNEAMHNLTKEELMKLGQDGLFIDGEDRDGDGIFVAWNGNPVPYLKWKDDDPDGDECLRLSSGGGYDFADLNCSGYDRGCICEKDIP